MAIRRTLAEFSDDIATADIADDAITGGKLANDIAISTTGNIATTGSGTLAVAGASTLTGNVTAAGTLAVTGNATASGNLTVTGDIVPSTPLSHRHMIINGAMQVAQRATSVAGMDHGNDGYRTCDRFAIYMYDTLASMVLTNSQNSITDNEGFRKTYKILITTAETSIGADSGMFIEYEIEAQDLTHLWYGNASAKTTTLSFYVRSNETGNFALELYSEDGDRCIGTTYTVSNTNWQRVTWTIPGDASGTINNDTGSGLKIRWHLTAGSNFSSADNTSWAASSTTNDAYGQTAVLTDAASNYWEITGVQFEVGSNATPFEHRPYTEEFFRCCRYYDRIANNYYGEQIVCWAVGSNIWYGLCKTKNAMRATPTVIWAGSGNWSTHKDQGSGVNPYTQVAPTIAQWNKDFYHVTLNSGANFTGLTDGGGPYLATFGSARILSLDAEL